MMHHYQNLYMSIRTIVTRDCTVDEVERASTQNEEPYETFLSITMSLMKA